MAATETQKKSLKRKRETEREAPRKERSSSADSSANEERGEVITEQDAQVSLAKKRFPGGHSKKERKQNRSTRIHSLRKLLARGNLPSDVKRDKERELAALLHEQEKNMNKKVDRKVLEKYHYVRFIERQKAEKRLKSLQKKRESTDCENPSDLDALIEQMNVNRAYAIYAPLNQKYVSVLASGSDLVELDNRNSRSTAQKPKMWYAIKEAMAKGERALETIRDGGTIPLLKDTRSQVRDKSEIMQEKISSSKGHERSQQQHERSGINQNDSQDEDAVDGGFFER